MNCPSREHGGFGPKTKDAGTGYIQECPTCHRLWTRDGVEVMPADLPKHNPGHEEDLIGGMTDEEWRDVIYG